MTPLESRAQALERIAGEWGAADSTPGSLEHSAILYCNAASTWRGAAQSGGDAGECYRAAELCALRGAAVMQRLAGWNANQAGNAVH